MISINFRCRNKWVGWRWRGCKSSFSKDRFHLSNQSCHLSYQPAKIRYFFVIFAARKWTILRSIFGQIHISS